MVSGLHWQGFPLKKSNWSGLTLPRITGALGGCARTATIAIITTNEAVGSPLMERLVQTPLYCGRCLLKGRGVCVLVFVVDPSY